MATVATAESLAAMGDLVSKLVSKHAPKKKQILDGDMTVRKRQRQVKSEKSNLREKRRLKKELMEKGRIYESDVLVERQLSRMATRGVIQLFNAVKQHQKNIETKMKSAKTEAQKDKINESISTGSFLDLVLPKKKPPPQESSSQVTEKDKKWAALKDNFMLDNKPKHWGKPSANTEQGFSNDEASVSSESGSDDEES